MSSLSPTPLGVDAGRVLSVCPRCAASGDIWRFLQPLSAQVPSPIQGVPPKQVNLFLFYCCHCTQTRYENVTAELDAHVNLAAGLVDGASL